VTRAGIQPAIEPSDTRIRRREGTRPGRLWRHRRVHPTPHESRQQASAPRSTPPRYSYPYPYRRSMARARRVRV